MSSFKNQRPILLLLIIFFFGLFWGEDTLADSCEIRLGQSDLDFGQIKQTNTDSITEASNLYTIGTRFISLNVTCSSSSKLLLILRGESIAERFRFAADGQLKVRLSNALLNGRAVDLAQIASVGDVPSQPASTVEVSPGDLIVPVSAGLAAEGSLLSMQIEISPRIGLRELRARDSKSVQGNINFEVREY